MDTSTPALFLYDDKQQFQGVFISPDLWEKIEPAVRQHLAPPEKQEPPEPMQDWETLVQFWDFGYPVNTEAECGQCGEQTTNWSEDDPRKFRLLNANLGGLVTLRCLNCQAKVIRRHFKDQITSETQPYTEKDPTLNAYYGTTRHPGKR